MTPANRSSHLVVLFCLLVGFTSTSKADSISGVAKNLGDRVLKYMENRGKGEIYIDQLRAPVGVNPKPFEQALKSHLTSNDTKVLSDTDIISIENYWQVTGRLISDPGGSAAINVKLDIEDNHGNRLTGFNDDIEPSEGDGDNTAVTKQNSATDDAKIDTPADVPKIRAVVADVQGVVEKTVGAAVDTSLDKLPDASLAKDLDFKTKVRSAVASTIAIGATKPKTTLEGSLIGAGTNSKFRIEVLKSETNDGPFRPVNPVLSEKGFPTTELTEGDFVRIRAINRNSFPVGLELLLDGINSLHFAEDPDIRASGKWLVQANSTMVVRGWFVSNSNQTGVNNFKITTEPNGVAAELGKNNGIGTIQANFYLAEAANTPSQNPIINLASAGRGKGAFGKGPNSGFKGRVVEARFYPNTVLASIGILHSKIPSDLPPN